MKEKFRCSEFGNPNCSDACLQCPSNSECWEEQQKISGLEQKAKTFRNYLNEELSFLEDRFLNRLLKNFDSFVNEFSEDKNREIAKLKEELVIVKAQRDGFDSMHGELEKRLGQIREHTKKLRKQRVYDSGWTRHYEDFDVDKWLEELVGLLGQNLEKPQPKKEKTGK